MKIQLGVDGSASAAATLADMEFQQCADGAFQLSNTQEPGSSSVEDAVRRIIVDGERKTSGNGDVRVLLRVKTRVPLASYNVNGTVVTNVPEIQVHTVLTLPRVAAAALQGTLTTATSTRNTGTDIAQNEAKRVIAEAISLLATIMTNQPCNYSMVASGLMNSPFFYGVMGVCPLDYASGDYGLTRVLPPPARS